ncbi:hypothetical protein Ae168Ps1_3791c [Pseudonocardia sp. Ae168_Ps1]|uniref:DUF4383 domain-containing protein n=1 Tax=unclassified Pseudonocardia TaxID=2619320 RepID=UPI00094AF105|nr:MULTISPECIES: DUF4383 domain-containing protein [unclassified Pseudonocardia]OLL75390.1 hypothetical protein Ae150APs1_3768c [Pseudonocardia sp. Ae150A_Ps1]OLL81385.1 hypothetical protein Ae168Ps1_3791c [Pseudonocardia sp. Ae168_Ps1]OLL84501.1 hypothetical protein Ae263Ps1_1556 [Pseudonocardia sp. Ae263_Ps1]OLL95479.1 hypothetical protein Ae356Ps1_5376c [Pseudonocardia sp. Ae356_Ps1]
MTSPGSDPRLLDLLHRISSALVGTVLWVFGSLGFADTLGVLTTDGPPLLGMSTNTLLSTISLVVGTVLIAAAIRGGRLASTVAVTVGALFLLSGVVNVVLIGTSFNPLAFRMSNVVFSLVVGLVLLYLGAYGRFSGRLPDDNPYAAEQRHHVDAEDGADRDQLLPRDKAGIEAARSLAETERTVAAGGGTERERRLLTEVDALRDPADRRAAWQERTGSGS